MIIEFVSAWVAFTTVGWVMLALPLYAGLVMGDWSIIILWLV